jgi:GDP/UDP-N,N'-diacetylbacillosamine 2-epimerase (hydrolysing)
MKIGVLTSSRADYGIYLPLLSEIKNDSRFDIEIIAFGSHVKEKFGNSINQILQDGYKKVYQIDNLKEGDSPLRISLSYAKTLKLFSNFWNEHSFDLVLCLGDRFEMAAAVNAGIPFQVNFAHFYAGDTTLGAIDNVYRHQISLASSIHFVATQESAIKVHSLLGFSTTTTVIGSLSLHNIDKLKLLSIEEFKEKWNIDLSIPTILITVNPETVNFKKNQFFAKEMVDTIEELSDDYQIVINPPNADTNGTIFRNAFVKLQKKKKSIIIIENFGSQSYFSCMKHAAILVGNTSSGIVEAASFQKYVINIGDRQKGRFAPENVIHLPFDSKKIIETTKKYITKRFKGINPYFLKESIQLTIKTLQTNKK